jgi:hypothetical protein
VEKYLKNWTGKNVDQKEFEIEPYELTDQDREDGIFRDILELTDYEQEAMCEDANIHESYMHMLSKYGENFDSGDKYLRVVQR